MRLGVRAALVDGILVDGDVTIEDGAVGAIGVQPAGDGGFAVPGFVDAHINGFAGVDFMTADAGEWRRAEEAMAATGVVAYQPTFVSSSREAYAEPLAVAGAVGAESGMSVGVHIEGPFLSPSWPGAHDVSKLIDPDIPFALSLLDAGPVTTMTLAPELPGALELIDALLARGVVVSCGHSDADAEVAQTAFARGARAITHIHNAHRRWKPRDPGIGGAALVQEGVAVQAIADGVHMAPESAYGVFLAAGPRFVLVTDAMEGAGNGDGDYTLAGRAVRVRDGAARLDDGTLAGSVLSMDTAVRNLVSWGAALPQAVHAASVAPAMLLGRSDLGTITPGEPANITVIDDDLHVTRTLIAGREAFAV
jgi:N-acetylglucosamine-6-phosphate deacetylase